MNTILIIAIAILGLSLTDAPSQTPYDGKNFAQEEEEKESLDRKIFKEIIKLPYYGVFDHIGYKFDGETVTLHGKVAVARNRKDAEYRVGKIAGVRQVVNNIEVLPLSPFDRTIRLRALRTFAARGGLFRYLQEPNPSVRIIVERGHVFLEGYVANRGDYNLMNILANSVTDVFSVKNNLIVTKEETR